MGFRGKGGLGVRCHFKIWLFVKLVIVADVS